MTVTEFALAGVREQLARAIHKNYLQAQQDKMPPDDPAMQPWEKLREDLKESNRQQADQIPEKLKRAGYGIRPASGGKPPGQWLTPEALELLARIEHDRWMAQKLAQSWTYGPIKDDTKKTHPCLVPWEELQEEDKEKDCQTVRQIPELLAKAGFEVYKVN